MRRWSSPSRTFVILGLVSGLGAFLLVRGYAARVGVLESGVGRPERVVVATRDVGRGVVLERSMLAVASWPSAYVPSGAVHDPAPASGRVLLAALGKGEVLTVAFNQVCVRSFQIGRVRFVSRDNAIAETRCKAFDLPFDFVGHIDCTTGWQVAIRPQRVLPTRCSLVEQTLLRDQDERTLRNFIVSDRAFSDGDFLQRPDRVNCAGAPARFAFPRNRCAQRVIQFENCGSMPKTFESPQILLW